MILKKSPIYIFFVIVFLSCSDKLSTNVEQSISFRNSILAKYSKIKKRVPPNLYPQNLNSRGKWNLTGSNSWTSGFYPGILWLLYQYTEQNEWKKAAIMSTQNLYEEVHNRSTHDLGFIMMPSFGRAYEMTNNKFFAQGLVKAAYSLISRYDPDVGGIKAWDNTRWEFPIIIDSALNVELLFWAADYTNENVFFDIAVSHLDKLIDNNVRNDGSTIHIVNYDSSTGQVKGTYSGQGKKTWARGQAWAILGFTLAYRETKDEKYLDVAIKTAEYYIKNLGEDYIPFWDLSINSGTVADKDASAAAIAVYGLKKLVKYLDQNNDFEKIVINTLKNLRSQKYYSDSMATEGVLKHCIGNKPQNKELNTSLIYADYYFLSSIFEDK